MKPLPSLARQQALLLAGVFIAVEFLVAVALLGLLLLPLARRSADDLAGLMVLSAQTWAELPPATRPDFEEALRTRHDLALRGTDTGGGIDEWHPPYFYLLEDALERRTGEHLHLRREADEDGNTWYWARLAVGGGHLAVGLPAHRVRAQPVGAALLSLGLGLLLAWVSAVWLARRITAPLAVLEQATLRIGRGESVEALPEPRSRELAALSHRFQDMARQVRELLAARTTLLAGISHDLRTPLARMGLALEMLKSDPSPALIARLEQDVAAMDRLIGLGLDLARGLEREAPTPVDLVELLSDVAAAYETPEQPIHLRSMETIVTLPRVALGRAIGNLLQNALRYAPGSAIDLVAEETDSGLRIGVLDRGPGIPVDRIEAMFQPFQRMEGSRSRATGGTGLGLAIVRELARSNGWQAELAPREGGGLEAWISLPLTAADQEATGVRPGA